MSARMQVIGRHGTSPNSIVYKTRLTREYAGSIDRADKTDLDSGEIWEVLSLKTSRREALR